MVLVLGHLQKQLLENNFEKKRRRFYFKLNDD